MRKDFHLNFKEVIGEIYSSVVTASQIAVICALIGVVATCIQVSGLGIKLPLLIQEISGGILLVALLIAMLSSILLGMGVPTAAAYMLVAIGAVPALLDMGVPRLSAHLFCFIFAALFPYHPAGGHRRPGGGPHGPCQLLEDQLGGLEGGLCAFLLPYFIIYVPLVTMTRR